MNMPSLDDFTALRGQVFALDAGGAQPLQALLLEAEPLAMAPHAGRQPFSLIFAGPAQPQLPQNTYCLAHPRWPALHIFLVPVGADATATRYQAVFT